MKEFNLAPVKPLSQEDLETLKGKNASFTTFYIENPAAQEDDPIEKRYLTLIIYRNKRGKDTYGIPGGKWEEGENAEQAAIREVNEELGGLIEIKEDQMTKITPHYLNAHTKDIDYTTLTHLFLAKLTDEQAITLEETAEKLNPKSDRFDAKFQKDFIEQNDGEVKTFLFMTFEDALGMDFYTPKTVRDFEVALRAISAEEGRTQIGKRLRMKELRGKNGTSENLKKFNLNEHKLFRPDAMKYNMDKIKAAKEK